MTAACQRSCTSTTPAIALMAPLICGVTVNLLPSETCTSRPLSISITRRTGALPPFVRRCAIEVDGLRIAHEDLEARHHLGCGLVEHLDALKPELHFLAFDVGLHTGDDGVSGFQKIAAGGERVREADGLELAGGIGKSDEGELVAGLGTAFLPVRDGSCELCRTRTLGEGLLMEACVSIDGKLLQGLHVVVERVAREVEAHGLELLREAVHRQPCVTARQHEIIRRARLPPKRSFCPTCAALAARLAMERIDSTASSTCARLGFRQSKAPALTRLSSARLLTTRASMRRAKSPANGRGRPPPAP